MANQIGALLSEESHAVILIPSRQETNAFTRALLNLKVPVTEDDLNNAGIEIKSFGTDQSALEESGYDVALLTTYPFLDKNYLLCDSVAKQIKMILYPCEESDYNFFNSLYEQIEGAYFTKERKDQIKSFLSGKEELENIKLSRVERDKGHAEVQIASAGKMPLKGILEKLNEIETVLEVSTPSIFQESIGRGSIKKGPGGEMKTSAIMVTFHNGDTLYVKEERTVQVLLASDDIKYELAKNLKVGETLILVNRDIKLSLNELILEKADEYPKLKILRIMVSIWINALKEGMIENSHTEGDLLKKLNEKGAKIKLKSTIKRWINGEVIGPKDLKNILRIADVYENDNLKRNAEEVLKSITQMRGLTHTILRRAKNALIEGESEEIEKLGINLSDFADAIEFFRIAALEHVDEIPVEKLDKIARQYEI